MVTIRSGGEGVLVDVLSFFEPRLVATTQADRSKKSLLGMKKIYVGLPRAISPVVWLLNAFSTIFYIGYLPIKVILNIVDKIAGKYLWKYWMILWRVFKFFIISPLTALFKTLGIVKKK